MGGGGGMKVGNFFLRLEIFFPTAAKRGDTQLEEENPLDNPLAAFAIGPMLDALLCILHLFIQVLPVK